MCSCMGRHTHLASGAKIMITSFVLHKEPSDLIKKSFIWSSLHARLHYISSIFADIITLLDMLVTRMSHSSRFTACNPQVLCDTVPFTGHKSIMSLKWELFIEFISYIFLSKLYWDAIIHSDLVFFFPKGLTCKCNFLPQISSGAVPCLCCDTVKLVPKWNEHLVWLCIACRVDDDDEWLSRGVLDRSQSAQIAHHQDDVHPAINEKSIKGTGSKQEGLYQSHEYPQMSITWSSSEKLTTCFRVLTHRH